MRSTRALVRSAAAAGLFAAVTITAGPAQAGPTSAGGTSGARPDTSAVAQVADRLGARSAGTYLDSGGRTHVAVTDAQAASAVRSAGGVAHQVRRSAAQLSSVTATLEKSLRMSGTAWAVDPATNQVVVSVDNSVSGARLATVRAMITKLGSAVRLETVQGTFSKFISGGDAIYGGGYRCSLGFNVRSGSTYYFLTAGHCTNAASTWYANSSRTTVLGTRTGTSFPGNDYGIVRYTSDISRPGVVNLYNGTTQDITSAGNAVVGQRVTRSGSTTGVRSGTVTAVNATVNYPEGRVSGLIRTTVCAEGGDSGGSLFAGTTALGLTSGGSGNCRTGGTTFFQPVTEPLGVYGVSVY